MEVDQPSLDPEGETRVDERDGVVHADEPLHAARGPVEDQQSVVDRQPPRLCVSPDALDPLTQPDCPLEVGARPCDSIKLEALAELDEPGVALVFAPEGEAVDHKLGRCRVGRDGVRRIDRAEEAVDANGDARPRREVARVIAGVRDGLELVEAPLTLERGPAPLRQPVVLASVLLRGQRLAHQLENTSRTIDRVCSMSASSCAVETNQRPRPIVLTPRPSSSRWSRWSPARSVAANAR